jgi:hypothetical protein
MKTSSCKQKGRRAVVELKESLMTHAPELEADDLIVTSAGETGVDLKLSPAAQKIYPFAIEAKNVEKLNIWAALEQSEGHRTDKLTPAVFFKRNRSEMYVAMKAEEFIKLWISNKSSKT